ncbi:HDOD domain-containing protein [Stutzerimonas azotifigens]|uniref:HDOD domain-containing protein n=1 Tax=Stutzerimonas azotifigens TaxID=291995 RepID=UPI00048639CF|nr:HDOD domain-containing protein [Stutzerimonas azotifigens]
MHPSALPLVLIAHPDPASRELIEAQVRALQPGARVQASADGASVLAGEQTQAADLLIVAAALSDMRGLDLLRELRRRAPARRASCLLVDAEADSASVREALPLGLSAYLTRPLSAEQLGRRLRSALPQASEQAAVPPLSDYLHDRRTDNQGAPLLADIRAAVAQCLRADRCDLGELEESFAGEPQIAARLISVANSAANYQGAACQSLAHALPRLGVKRALNLVLSLAIQRNARLADERLLRQARAATGQAQRAAELALWLAQRLGLDGESCYTAGLLQNIGELALLRVLQDWLDAGGELDEPTLERLLAEHAAGFGSALRAQWRLPLGLRQLIAAYYALGAGVFSREALLLNLTRQLVELPEGQAPASLADERAVRLLRLDLALLDDAPLIPARS